MVLHRHRHRRHRHHCHCQVLHSFNISNNYQLYAVETLLVFGAAATVETFERSHESLRQACFPASALRHTGRGSRGGGGGSGGGSGGGGGADGSGGGGEPHALPSSRLGQTGMSLSVERSNERAVVVAGVHYGHACTDNLPCGQKMALVPHGQSPPRSCGRTLPLSSSTVGPP